MTSKKNVQFLHPSPLPAPFFSLSEWVRIGRDPPTPEHRNLATSHPISFGILANNWNAKKETKMLSIA